MGSAKDTGKGAAGGAAKGSVEGSAEGIAGLRGGTTFAIGEMARMFGMNIRTLRYYDQIGLLKPEFVDGRTNYRYYSVNQFERLNTIRYLRALDVPIERIFEFFEGKDVDLLRGIFEDQLARVREKRVELALVERKIENRIAQIDEATSAVLDRVEVKLLPERRIVLLERSFAPSDDLEPLIRDLSSRNALDDAIFLGKVGVSIDRRDLVEGRFGRLSSVFIIVEAEDGLEKGDQALPAGTYATIRFRGTHAAAASSYAALMRRLSEEGLEPSGNSVEITIIDGGMTPDTSKYLTELQIPFVPPV